MSGVLISELWVYPIKSCAGTSLAEAEVEASGLALDRRWMVVDASGRFLSQRTHPEMAIATATPVGNAQLEVKAPGMSPLQVPMGAHAGPRRQVSVWDDNCAALSSGPDAAAWFSAFLGCACELVFMPESTRRAVDPKYARPDDRVGFADGYPFLLLSQASLDELNRRLDHPLPMNRFRPNIVVSGCDAHAEDRWSRIEVSGITLHPVKPCSRCAVTTVDQGSGARGREPLATLATYRSMEGKILFGQNLVHDGLGTLRVGDRCEVNPSTEDRLATPVCSS